MDLPEFQHFEKIPRFSRDIVITEKIDGTNGQLYITEDGHLYVGSRNRWINLGADNHGFARWAAEHHDELLHLGPGRHFGEWWGQGIQRRYGLEEKRFSLFNVHRWDELDPKRMPPPCCHVVPILYMGPFTPQAIEDTLLNLRVEGSHAAPGYDNPEGIVIYHTAGGYLFKKTFENDAGGKGDPS